MTPPESVNVALELERLRGTCEKGFTRVDGQLALLVQRNDQSDARLSRAETVIEKVEGRTTSLERKIWFALGGGSALGTVGGFLTAFMMQ